MSLGSAGHLPGGLVRISGLAVATHRHKGIEAGFDQALAWKAATSGSSVGRSLGGRRRPSEDHEYHQLFSAPILLLCPNKGNSPNCLTESVTEGGIGSSQVGVPKGRGNR